MLQSFFHRITQTILPIAQTLGAPGVALIALLDSSFLTFPEVTDALIVVLTVDRPERWLLFGAMATVGSWFGCLALFLVARRGGDAVLARWVKPETKERLFALFRRYGLATIVIGSLAPPPVPFKPFVVLAGVTGTTLPVFSGVVILSRGFRYIGEAWLSRRFGAQTVHYMNDHLGRAGLWASATVIVGAGGFWLWKRLRRGYNTNPAL